MHESVLPVVVDKREESFWRCPHCKQEIFEKHIYDDRGVSYHSDCQKLIELPKQDYGPQWNGLLGS